MSVGTGARPLFDASRLRPRIAAITGRLRRKVLVIANGKGGVGKSSLAAALAVFLTKIGMTVLLVELDPQGNNAEDLGFIGTHLYDAGKSQAQAILTGNGLRPTGEARPGLHVVPGGEALEDVIEELYIQSRLAGETGEASWLYMYACAIAAVEHLYDLIILDVAPGSRVLQAQAMVAGDLVLVPSRSDASSRKGLRVVAARIWEALPYNPALRLIGIVLFGVNSSARQVRQDIRADLEQDIQGAAPVLKSIIRYVESVAVRCRRLGMSPAELAEAPGVDAATAASARRLADDYRKLAKEVLTIIAAVRQEDAA